MLMAVEEEHLQALHTYSMTNNLEHEKGGNDIISILPK